MSRCEVLLSSVKAKLSYKEVADVRQKFPSLPCRSVRRRQLCTAPSPRDPYSVRVSASPKLHGEGGSVLSSVLAPGKASQGQIKWKLYM